MASAFLTRRYSRPMETRTNQALAAITDEGLFERIVTAVLRLIPEYEGIAHTGINADGKTRRSPVDGLRFTGENGDRLILAHHTTTAADRLERKWLFDPCTAKPRRGSKNTTPAGDVIKAIEIVAAERTHAPELASTLVLTTNREPDEALVRKAVAAGRAAALTIDVWTRSRIAARLDTDPRGQFIRRKLLGIEAELISRPLLETLSDASLATFDAGDNPDVRVARSLDDSLLRELRPVTFLVAPSGSGKTVASHKALAVHRAAGGLALVVPHAAIEGALNLEQAVMAALHQLHPALAPDQNVFALFSEEDPLLVLVEDVSRSGQPQRLIETIAGWAPKGNQALAPPWRILCPVWPHLLGGVRSQFQDRIEAMTLRPEPMSLKEAARLVTALAARMQVTLDEPNALHIAAALGEDPLLIALNRDWDTPKPEAIIQRFVSDALIRVQASDNFVVAELDSALMALGQAMLAQRAIDPAWSDIVGWGLPVEALIAIKRLAQQGEILRIDGPTLDTRLRFRHDRVRDWLLITAALRLEAVGELADDTLGDPALSEIIGAVLVRAGAPPALLEKVQALAPLALFHALRVGPVGAEATRCVADAAMAWLGDPSNHGRATATLRWQAMAALEEVEGDFMIELIGLFQEDWPMGLVSRLRNGDVEGGIALSTRWSLNSVAYWTKGALTAGECHRAKMILALEMLLDQDDDTAPKRRAALIEFAGILGDSALGPALERLWVRDETRGSRLDVYLWAIARCTTPETAARMLDPVCDAWSALSDTRETDGMPSPRDNLAASDVRFGFEILIPHGALAYFIERAKQSDLSWQIEYMLHGVDHPTAILFEVERGAERRRASKDGYTFNNQARDHWGYGVEGWGTPMSQRSRTGLLDLWRDENTELQLRRTAFDFWAASRGADDVGILRRAADDPDLRDSILRHRLQRGDTLAIPKLIEQLSGENGMRWWYYARYVWSSALYVALDHAIAQQAAKPLPDDNAQYEIGSTLTRPLLKLPPSDAEPLLLRYWDKFGATMHFVQAALYVATPELLERASAVIVANAEPEKLFEHIFMHYGLRMSGEAGLTRKLQVRALAPYFHLLRENDLEDLARACDENGWYELRRELIDPRIDTNRSSPAALRRALDESLERLAPSWIEHQIDDLRKAGVRWKSLAAELRDWLSTQPSDNALEAVSHAIGYAGGGEDVAILSSWPGTDHTLREATATDLRFAMRRRIRAEP